MGPDPGPLNGPATEARPLAELAAGRWSRWTGLPPGTTFDDVVSQLGPSLDAQPHSGVFGGSPTMFRRWDEQAGAPRGLTVWLEADLVAGVEIRGAARDPADAALADPDEVFDSGLGSRYSQLVWGRLGLVVHQEPDDREAALLLGLAAFDPASWANDPLRWWSQTRRR